ncbi:MAG TPA: acyl-CoA thioesterase, partial [Nannocystis sp.]
MTVYGVEALRRVPGGIASRDIAGGAGDGSDADAALASGSEDTGVSGIVPRMSDTPEEVPAGVHEHRRAVVPEDIDELGHVNNLRYLEWMMAAAIEHSEAVGWDGARYAALGNAWVVRSHAIEYLRPAFAGDAVVVRTWVSEMAKVSSRRKYAIAREGGPVLARAETLWVYINRRTHTLDRVPADLRAA